MYLFDTRTDLCTSIFRSSTTDELKSVLVRRWDDGKLCYWMTELRSKTELQYDLLLDISLLEEIIMISTDNKASFYDALARNVETTRTTGLSGSAWIAQTQTRMSNLYRQTGELLNTPHCNKASMRRSGLHDMKSDGGS